MMYRIPLTQSGAIPQVTANDRRLPVVDIPLEIEHAPGEIILLDNTVQTVDTYIFYCHSKPKSEKQQTGDGTKENPWDDLNVALEKLCCIIHNSCDNCIACKLIVSGTIDYNVQPSALRLEYDGRHRLYIDFAQAILQYSELGDGPVVARFSRIRNSTIANVNLTDTYFVNGVSFETVHAFHSCHYCRFDSCVISTPCSAMISCDHCVFDDVSVYLNKGGADSTSAFGSCYYSVFNNCKAFVQKVSAEFYSGWNAINGFDECWDGIFQNCTATFEGSGCCNGCGFTGNTNPTWIGSNVGYSIHYLLDDDGYCYDISVIYQTNQNCSDIPESSSPIPPSSSSSSSGGTPDSRKGSIACHAFKRSVKFRLFDQALKEPDTCGVAEMYVTSIAFNWEHTPCSEYQGGGKAYPNRKYSEISRYYGKLASVKGELLEGDDGNADCSYEATFYCDNTGFYMDDANGEPVLLMTDTTPAANAGTSDINKLIEGTLYSVPEFTDIPINKRDWTGFNNYYRCGGIYNISPHMLNKQGDTLTVNTKTEVDYYSSWGGTPCSSGDGSGFIELDTYVFEWRPKDTNNAKKPQYFILEDANGDEIRCDFMTEYCLQGNADIDRDMVSLTTCSSVSGVTGEDTCNHVVIKGTTKAYNSNKPGVTASWDGDFQKPQRNLTRTYKLKSVEF